MDDVIFQRDQYDYMRSNSKLDLLVYKKRCFDLDVKMMRENTKLRNLRKDHDSQIKLSRRCKQMASSVEKNVQRNTL